jgi:hypothetical protein
LLLLGFVVISSSESGSSRLWMVGNGTIRRDVLVVFKHILYPLSVLQSHLLCSLQL